MITHDRLLEVLNYDQRTGIFTWKNPTWPSQRKNGCLAGSTHADGYIAICIDQKFYYAHRLAWFYVNRVFPDGPLDHIDQNKSNNAISNLRRVDAVTNCQNRPMQFDNQSGVTGVYWHKNHKKWRAVITVARKKISLGSYNDFNEAVTARKSAEIKYGFHPNHGLPKELESQ